jgi:hypothetical protein
MSSTSSFAEFSSRCTRSGFNFYLASQIPVIAAIVLWGQAVWGANLLVNPGFDQNSGHHVPTGWTRFEPPTAQHPADGLGNFYIEAQVAPHSAPYYFKEWGASYNGTNNVAGIYQDLSSAPGSTYQASGWFYTRTGDMMGADNYAWIEVAFLGASTNTLALFKSANFSVNAGMDTWLQYQVTNACNPSQPVSLGDPFFTTYAVTGSVSQLVAPPGTTTVRYRFAYFQSAIEGGSGYFDDFVLNQISGSAPPVISSLFPQNMIFVNPNDGISFNVSSTSGNTINHSGVHLVVNGTDVSGSLVFGTSGSSTNVSYHGLQSNLTYTASITVTDSVNFTASANTYFETTWVGVPPVKYLWEAEDFDFSNGLYINNPALCSVSGNPNCYFGKVGVEGVDEHLTGNAPYHFYRADDAMGTVASGDLARPDHYAAGVLDYRVDPFNGVAGSDSSWLNYTRDWPAGTYWIVGRVTADISHQGKIILSKVNADTSTTDLGTFTMNGLGYGTYQNVFLKDTNGNNATVTLNGKATLRATSGGDLLPGFFMLVSGQVDLPTLSNVYPSGAHPFEYTNALSFTVTTVGATFAANGITVNLDGNDISSSLAITGSTSVKNVVYPSLLPNAIHVAIITATNSLGHGIRVTNHFDTFNESNYMVEAEDYDYNGGQFFDPWSPDVYAGQGATTNIDFQHTTLDGQTAFGLYRTDGIPEDRLGQHDWLRHVFPDSGGVDYVLVFFAGGDWVNYTRAYPAGNYYVYGRFSGGGPFTMYLDQVVSGAGTTTQVAKRLGQWSAVGKDYVTYDWVPLTDAGLVAPVAIKLNGVSTLRITTVGFCNPNYFMLVPATGIAVTAARSGSNTVISFPTQTGANYRVFYRTDLTSTNNWVLLTSVLGNGSVKSAIDTSSASQRFYKVVAP